MDHHPDLREKRTAATCRTARATAPVADLRRPARGRCTTGWDPVEARARYEKLLRSLLPGNGGVASYAELNPFVEKLLGRLDPQEAHVLRLRHGLTDGYPKSWQEVSEVMGLEQEQARQLSERALAKLLFVLTCRFQSAGRN